MLTATATYAFKTPEGGWRLTDSRVSLDSIVQAYWQGRQPEAIAADFPTLSLEQIHGAIAFYLRNQTEIDAYLLAQDARWEELRRQSEVKAGPLLNRMRMAALAVRDLYEPGGELTEWTVLDGEEILDDISDA